MSSIGQAPSEGVMNQRPGETAGMLRPGWPLE